MDPLDYAMEHLSGAKRYPRYVAAICPFHEDRSPSLLVYPDGFICTACREKGPLEKLWKRASIQPLLPHSEAHYHPLVPRDWDNDRLSRSAHGLLLEKPGLQQYLLGRGLERGIRRFELGYWDGWYTVPVKDEAGHVDEVVFRAGPWVQKQTGERFFQRSGQKPRLYAPDISHRGHVLFVTFGIFDACTLSLLGYPAVTSTIGKGSFKADWVGWHDGYIVIIPDLGEEREAHLLAAGLGWRGRVLLLPYPEGTKDPNDLLVKAPDLLVGCIDGYLNNIANRLGPCFSWPGVTRSGRPALAGASL